MTIVGERGIALSGGQRARVNLARAVYKQANIYLFDDPLSAVDPKVSRHLMDNCVLGSQLSGSLKVVATHQLQYLPQADYIVVLNQVCPSRFNFHVELVENWAFCNDQGTAAAQGTYDQLVADGIDFVSLLSTSQTAVEATRKDNESQSDTVTIQYFCIFVYAVAS
jgi:ABC-type protease/lipase transport system fused ATPase/permease subunit